MRSLARRRYAFPKRTLFLGSFDDTWTQSCANILEGAMRGARLEPLVLLSDDTRVRVYEEEFQTVHGETADAALQDYAAGRQPYGAERYLFTDVAPSGLDTRPAFLDSLAVLLAAPLSRSVRIGVVSPKPFGLESSLFDKVNRFS